MQVAEGLQCWRAGAWTHHPLLSRVTGLGGGREGASVTASQVGHGPSARAQRAAETSKDGREGDAITARGHSGNQRRRP
eukprot:9533159-Alexandrium_andersonii.AAC.1